MLGHVGISLSAYLGVKFMKNVFKVVTLDRLLRVEKVEEFLDELGSDINFEAFDFDGLVDHKL